MAGERNLTPGRRALAATAATAALVRRATLLDPHVVRTSSGVALVYTVRRVFADPVRVLRTGGVYQSATYLGARRMEPVFE